MIVSKTPKFESGNILSQEMLEIMNQKNMLIDYFKYLDYSSGILKGFIITTTEGYINVGKGSYIFDGEIQYVNEEISIPYSFTNKLKILVIRTSDKEIERQFEVRRAEIKLIFEEEKLLTDIEICRFCVQPGAQLRNDIKNFDDMSTYYNTVCVCHAQWSSYTGQTVSYPVLKQFAEELAKLNTNNIHDDLILSHILSLTGESVSFKYLEMYLNKRLEKKLNLDTPFSIYSELKNVLKTTKGAPVRSERRTFGERKIFVD